MSKARDIADLDFNSPDIDGGNIDGATIGGTTPAAGSFNSLTVDGSLGDWSVNSEGARMHFSRPSANYINAEDEAGYLVFQTSNSETALTLNTNQDAYFSNVVNVTGRDGAETVFNDGSTTANFRVETNDQPNMLFIDGGDNQIIIGANSSLLPSLYGLYARNGLLVGNFSGTGNGLTVYRGASINTNINHDSTKAFVTTSGHPLHLRTSDDANYKISMETDGVVINEAGNDYDFRVESNNNNQMLFVNGGEDRVAVGASGAGQTGSNFYVEGRSTLYNGSVTGGSVLITDSYSGATNDHLLNIGTQRSSGGPFISYGLGQNGTNADWISTYDNFSGSHSTLTFNGSSLEYYCDVSDSATTVGNTVALQNGFKVGRDGAIFNDDSYSGFDFRVESDNNANILFIDASADTVNIGNTTDFGGILNVNGGLNSKQAVFTNTNNRGLALSTASRSGQNDGVAIIDAQDTESTGGRLELHTMGVARASFERDQIVFNEGSNTQDFRVETNNHAHTLFVDGGNDSVSIRMDGSYGSTLQVQGAIGTVNGHTDLVSVTNNIGSVVTNGEISHTIGFSGTYGSGRTFTWTYNSGSWKAFRVRLEVGSTAGFAVFEGGGYNNNGLTSQVIEHDGNNVGTFSISANGQTNSYTLTLNTTHIHPYFKFVLGQSGGDSFPRLSNLSLVQA